MSKATRIKAGLSAGIRAEQRAKAIADRRKE